MYQQINYILTDYARIRQFTVHVMLIAAIWLVIAYTAWLIGYGKRLYESFLSREKVFLFSGSKTCFFIQKNQSGIL